MHDDGLLWLINRCVFHPRGLALAHKPGTDEWELVGNGTEVWSFSAADDDSSFAKWQALLQRLKKADADNGSAA